MHSVISVDSGEAAEQTTLPAVFTAPIRPDIVRTIHTNMAKNKRQAYAVKVSTHGRAYSLRLVPTHVDALLTPSTSCVTTTV